MDENEATALLAFAWEGDRELRGLQAGAWRDRLQDPCRSWRWPSAGSSTTVGPPRELMSRRVELARDAGDVATVGSESSNLSMVERQLGNLERADQLAIEALEIGQQRGDEWMASAAAPPSPPPSAPT